jgi:futalosine hydrolase
MPEILIVAATEAELCGRPGLVCGVGPVEAAAATASALTAKRVDAILHVGIAGARRDSGIAVGDIVAGREARYEDLVTTRRLAPDVVSADQRLVAAACEHLGVRAVVIGTTARVAGGICPVEAMEGFAVLRAAELAGVPAVEVRAISNHVEDQRSDWRMDDAVAALADALPRLTAVVAAVVSAAT